MLRLVISTIKRGLPSSLLPHEAPVSAHVPIKCWKLPAEKVVGAGVGLQLTRFSSSLLMNLAVNKPQQAWSVPSALRTAYTDSRGYTHFNKGGTNRWGLGRGGQLLAAGVVVGSGTYYYRSIEVVPYTGRKHAILCVTLEQERALGAQLFQEQLREAQAAHALVPPNHPYTQLIRRVGSEIVKVATDAFGGGYVTHMQNLDWEFAVINSPVPNAFVVPGGKVVMYTGLLELLDSEDELAAVLAHETAHVLARHHAERISILNVFAIAKLVFWALLGVGLPNAAMVLGMFLPYSRRAEHEADEIGVQLMARACYDPSAAASMLAKLHAKEQQMSRYGQKLPQFLSTHPLTDDRVSRVEGQLPLAYTLYQRSGCAHAHASFTKHAKQ